MYTPKLPDSQVRQLYRLKQVVRKPMTVLIKEAVDQYLKQYPEIIKEATDNERS
ncbi:MAG: hypothetical protein KKA84_16215 [Bacteroidetes bacterium]|nr:hypothetical protein [Bacteroidota bacterium]